MTDNDSDADDELEARKNDVWSLGEARNAGAATATPGDNEDEDDHNQSDADNEDGAGGDAAETGGDGAVPTQAADTTGATDTANAADTTVTSDTVDTSVTGEMEDTSQVEETTEQDQLQGETRDVVSTRTHTDSQPSGTRDSHGDADPESVTVNGDTVREMTRDAAIKDVTVRDMHNVNVYLYEEIYQEMRAQFKQLDGEYFATHDKDLEKNKEFFNAVFRAGLNSPQLKVELELDSTDK